jgi:AraC-like DNA-binding protein
MSIAPEKPLVETSPAKKGSPVKSAVRAGVDNIPFQYQKHLRLQEARRLMLAEDLDATRAAFHVGYESSSQFNREYSRLFGAPPLRDVAKLRQVEVGLLD